MRCFQSGVVGQVEETKDYYQHYGNHNHQPLSGALLVFILATPVHVVAGRQLHLARKPWLGLVNKAITLSGRKPADRDFIEQLSTMGDLGVVIIDDFHRLPNETKQSIADFMKVLADEGREESKLVLLGINKAGDHV